MTDFFKKPHAEENLNPDSKNEIQYKRPEFIILDDRENIHENNGSEENGERHGKNTGTNANQQSSISLRFLCFLGLVFCLIFGTGLLLITVLTSAAAVLMLLLNRELNQTVLTFWKLFFNTLIAGIGCMIGLVSPAMGISLLALYFSISKKKNGANLFSSLFENTFKKF
ncbi:MAG: hypothetical protein H0V82_00195 [Candidatus Protochlamydia sp.]|nr:hypothetical protein [Candidatus Protochlamydia sp.]